MKGQKANLECRIQLTCKGIERCALVTHQLLQRLVTGLLNLKFTYFTVQLPIYMPNQPLTPTDPDPAEPHVEDHLSDLPALIEHNAPIVTSISSLDTATGRGLSFLCKLLQVHNLLSE